MGQAPTVQIEEVKQAFQELERVLDGEVRYDKLSRMLYASDASLYQVEPYGVVLPKHEDDLIRTIQVAHKCKVPLIPRAAGTSLAGQCVGHGIVVDISKYMNRILVKDADEAWAWVHPGVIQDELSRAFEADGLYFGPDTSTSNRAMIGGMIGNNSCGSHSIYYGRTSDHVYEIDVVLSDGSKARFRDLTPDELEQKKQLNNLEGHIYRGVTKLLDEHRTRIKERFPKIMRSNTGYLLDQMIREDVPFNLSRLICGSEGTLAMISRAKVKLSPRPKTNGIVAIHFETLEAALEATVEAIEFDPCAVELIDRVVLDLTLENATAKPLRFFIQDDPDAILAVEFYGDSQEAIEAQMDQMEARLKERAIGFAYPRLWGEDTHKIWKLRKAGLGILMGMPGDAKPISFVEDTAVDPKVLPAYIADFKKIMAKYGTECTYYAHASVGLLHMRPILNLREPSDIDKMEAIASEVVDIVIKHGGAVSGEHGDGRVRAPFHEQFFGPELYQAMREIKTIFDPHNLFNPNKIVDALPMREDLRITPQQTVHHIPTALSFEKQHGYLRATEYCNGAGACRKSHLANGTMCPSYQATLEETHTTRGRANVLRTAIHETGPVMAFTSPEVYEVMDLCLECKACKSECPANVDMAKLKYEYLQRRWDLKGIPLAVHAFANIALLNSINFWFGSLVNKIVNSRFGKYVLKKLLHVHPKRSLPQMAAYSFKQWFKKHTPHPNAGSNGRTVHLFNDPLICYNEPQILASAVHVLEAAGYDVGLSPIFEDGRPQLSKGLTRRAKALAERNIRDLLPVIDEGIPLIGVEPSTILTFRDEYLDFFPHSDDAKRVAAHSFLIDEFLVKEAKAGRLKLDLKAIDRDFLVHGHCFQKSLVGITPTLEMLRLIPRARPEALNTGCCGMAGSFGYDLDKYDVSMKIGEQILFPAVRNRGDAEVVAFGTSCRHQMLDGTDYHARHPIQVLAEAITPTQTEGKVHSPSSGTSK